MEDGAMKRLTSGCLLLLCLVACDRAPKPAPSIPYAKPGVQFTVTPVAGDCTRASVAWKLPESMPAKVEIQVGSDTRQVFARSNEHEGHEPTGAWVRPRMVFYLVDRESGDVIAATRVGRTCVAEQERIAGPKDAVPGNSD
jgi:hypothetical protein